MPEGKKFNVTDTNTYTAGNFSPDHIQNASNQSFGKKHLVLAYIKESENNGTQNNRTRIFTFDKTA